ncbi:hypothetical protein K488DRAFT_47324 [Vararia minispora EC-137]|uniref:Uncharacterized protein n=1 Tax=Vararia minispora EC-137 TaxID=1314806 RepID=A0ACB8QQF5_9AGAM|nr:hypothetical protein K488DRAFT_47324 [Vararia minispora EC-137]
MVAVSAKFLFFSSPADGSKAWQNINSDPGTGIRQRNWVPVPHTIEVEDLRGKEDATSLDTTGFRFFRHPAKHTSFASDEEIQREYYPESIDLIKKATGASRAVIFDHTVRRRRPEILEDTPDKRQPVQMVHVDQTPKSAEDRVRRHVPEDAEELLKKRYQIINLWRPIGNPALDWPLALCDYRSTDQQRDLEPMTLRYPDRHGETFGVKFSPAQRWKYVSGMTPEEGVLIKCFDSVQDGATATLTPHTAFEDPTTPPNAPKRESIELRALVFYD